MNYFKKVPSLEERASLEVALNLCQESCFKAVALCLERPTYGFFYLEGEFPLFVSNPKKLQKLIDKKTDQSNNSSKLFGLHKDIDILEYHKKPPFVNDPRLLSLWEKTGMNLSRDDFNDQDSVGRWYFEVEQQCQKLTKNLPNSLKFNVSAWINRIALEYISYCRRLEVLFGVSRYFLMNFLTREDWTEACRLDEKKVAKRLLKDERLTVSQRYCIACVYCLLDDISQLWKRLTINDKYHLYETTELTMPEEIKRLIQIWSLNWNKDQDEATFPKTELLFDVMQQLVIYGNVTLLIPFWKKLEEQVRQNKVIDLALMSLKHWYTVESDSKIPGTLRKKLLSNEIFSMQNYSVSCVFNLQSYYSELILFFLSEMNENQKLLFLQKSFEMEQFNILECFLDWPLRDYFLEIINQLWEILPINKYRHCLVVLANLYNENYHTILQFEYSKNYKLYYFLLNWEGPEAVVWCFMYDHYCKSLFKKVNQYYSYRSLLWKLWETTPQTYKQKLFFDQNIDPFLFKNSNGIEFTFFRQLLKRSPFQIKDEELFKNFVHDLPETFRKPMIHSEVGEDICSALLEKEKYSLVTWLLQQCLEEDEISRYKKQFIYSKSGRELCFYKLQENYESSLLDLLDWSFDLDSDKTQFKHELFNERSCFAECRLLLKRGEFTEVERIMNFFSSSSDEFKKEFKARCAEFICDTLLANNKFEQLDEVLRWCFDTEDNIKDFKKDLFSQEDLDTHYRLVFLEKWKDVQWFYEWFELSTEEIKKLKKKTVFRNLKYIKRGLFHSKDVMAFYVAPLRWCLTDEKTVITFKNRVEEKFFNFISVDKERVAKKRLSYLVKELLSGIRKGIK